MNFPMATIEYPEEYAGVLDRIEGGGVTTFGASPKARASILQYDPVARRMRVADVLKAVTIEEDRDGYLLTGRSQALHNIADDGGLVTIRVIPDPRCKKCSA